jgi:hypothetical protein
VKPDLRVLFKLFSVAAVCHERHGNISLGKFESQSIPMIAVGRCTNSNGIQFYNPANGTFVSSIDYKFQSNVTSGAHFGLKYQPGVFIYRLDESNSVFSPTYALDSSVYVHTHSPPSVAKVVGIPKYTTPNLYTVVFKDGSISEYTDDLLSTALDSSLIPSQSLLPSWIKGGANATLFLHDMSKPRHGKLQSLDGNIWYFFPGKSKEGIVLKDLLANCRDLLDTGQLTNVYNARSQYSLRDCVLRHVSAHGLQSLLALISLKSHAKMDLNDKSILDAAYDEEYDGLVSIATWRVITEDEFFHLLHLS